MACDDGDIIAYYTHQLNAEISRNLAVQRGSISETAPMFHENVGITAWGLAIHEHSRLIAVSSNRHEITVFAFAIEGNILDSDDTTENDVFPNHDSSAANQSHPMYNGSPGSSKTTNDDWPPGPYISSTATREFPSLRYLLCSAREGRHHNYKSVYHLDCPNIPSIDFYSGQDLHADSIFATDISGNLWVSLFDFPLSREPISPTVFWGLIDF